MSYRSQYEKIKRALEESMEIAIEDLGDELVEEATHLVPVKTGTLQRSIKWERFNDNELGKDTQGIHFMATAPHSGAVEYGSLPHTIKPDPNRATIGGKPRTNPHLRFQIGDKVIYAKEVFHPGTEAQPFMRPAIDNVAKHRATVTRIWKDNTRKQMEKRGLRRE